MSLHGAVLFFPWRVLIREAYKRKPTKFVIDGLKNLTQYAANRRILPLWIPSLSTRHHI